MDQMIEARAYFPGMGEAVADRTVNRRIFTEKQRQKLPKVLKLNLDDPLYKAWSNAAELSGYPVKVATNAVFMDASPETRMETWAEVAQRVAEGNTSLVEDEILGFADRPVMEKHLRQASLLMSGRHLQHGDARQKDRPMEVFTNCLGFSNKINTLEFGPVEIGKIVGETVHVLAADGEWRPAEVKSYGVQQLYRVEFGPQGGGKTRHVVTATANHRWLLNDGTVTEELAIGDVLQPIRSNMEEDPDAVVHGLVFGDGTAHKTRSDTHRTGVSYGRTYASVRVCKQDAAGGEIHAIFDAAGYRHTTPPHAKGDRVYYIGKLPFAKELPATTDGGYIEGFIRGWWLADGAKQYSFSDAVVISTVREDAVQWLRDYAGFAGYSVVSVRRQDRKEGDGSYTNGKPLFTVRLRKGVKWVVRDIEAEGRETVYCVEEPVTQSFTLANGLLTGNCSTAAASFLKFYLLLNGSGVGRAYDDAMMKVDWRRMPNVYVAIDADYPDRNVPALDGNGMMVPDSIKPLSHYEALIEKGLLGPRSKVTVFRVPDSRGGWAKAVELVERMTYEERTGDILILDFSDVRPYGSPIRGMQNRPSSGPGPLMEALVKVAAVRHLDLDLEPWETTMHVDHHLSACVMVGGARRAARMATKYWKDPGIFRFIDIKQKGNLWSSNNSVTIDDEFRAACRRMRVITRGYPELSMQQILDDGLASPVEVHAWKVLRAIAHASYHHGTGEPGIINQDRLTAVDAGIKEYLDGLFANSRDYQVDGESLSLMRDLAKAVLGVVYTMITNPCGEIALLMLGAYCVIADVVPFHATNDDDAEEAFRVAVRALIRTNTMDCLYAREVKRTNRIGVGMTGFHEWAYARFGFTWHDLIDEAKSIELWQMVGRFKRAVLNEAETFSAALGVTVPHTNTTFKPAGTTSKLFGLSEGAHLPSMRWYLRWVQFRNDDPLVAEYAAKGYPVKKLVSYPGVSVVGFPTAPTICQMDGGDWVVTAAEATPEEQYQFLRLLEKYWITGVEEDGVTPLPETGNQISYTLKYNPEIVSFEEFFDTLLEGQFTIRCCSVMPQTDVTAYEYQPEEPITKERYLQLMASIEGGVKEEIDFAHVGCGSGGCPVDFEDRAPVAA